MRSIWSHGKICLALISSLISSEKQPSSTDNPITSEISAIGADISDRNSWASGEKPLWFIQIKKIGTENWM